MLATKNREFHQLENTPFSLKNGIWKIKNRFSLWQSLGSRIFDEHIENLKKIAVSVLTEKNPAFDLEPESRFFASAYDKHHKYSQCIRKGLSEILAILGNNSESLTNCSDGKAKNIVSLSLAEIFDNADWRLWASLNDLLPILSEADPSKFLDSVEKALNSKSCPFTELFAQESTGGITGRNYMIGLLWALEGLAWDEKYLVRSCIVLGGLANDDPGGNYANRPKNSLATILLPWFPQTTASIKKRKAAVKTICNEYPEVGWNLLLSLLPNKQSTTSGSHKPEFRNIIPGNWEDKVSNKDYWDQVSFYADLAVSMAKDDTKRIEELIKNLANLPKPAFKAFMNILSSSSVLALSENKRLAIWNNLMKFTVKNRRFSDAKWALNEEVISSIESVADKIKPKELFNIYHSLFSDGDYELYGASGDWNEEDGKIKERRINAINEILKQGGIKNVLRFVKTAKRPYLIGQILGEISSKNIDKKILPRLLKSKNTDLLLFLSGYIWSRNKLQGWSWTDETLDKSWDNEQMTQFFISLPFTSKSWSRVSKWLKKSGEKKYWEKAWGNPYQAQGPLATTVRKLVKYGRSYSAIECLDAMRYRKKKIDTKLCATALLSALKTSESPQPICGHSIRKLIEILQNDPDTNQDDLFKVEWAYIPLFNDFDEGYPKLLTRKMTDEPEFFSEIIRLIYKSDKTKKEEEKEISKEKKQMAENAWKLLRLWNIVPGTSKNGNFNEGRFADWLDAVRKINEKSGHLDFALVSIGNVLIHSPADSNGLWINEQIAKALNEANAEKIRNGFRMGVFNSRGVHWVDPTGAPEKKLADNYREKGEDLENKGYYRFSQTLKQLGDIYDGEAERIIKDNNSD